MEKQLAITILEDIYNSLQGYDWKKNGLKTLKIYRQNLEIATNKKIQNLIEKQKKYIKKYGEDSKKAMKLNKKFENQIYKILYEK